ncbi:MAG: hypothetical protein M0Q93_09435 [Terrimicrobiaceae bacterium]|nr:hypothetical protein [Terrimicrobiaceae bacterium]
MPRSSRQSLATAMLPLAAHAKQDPLPGMRVQPTEYFYTGKPYESDTGSYTFKYRNYDPELNRWTTMDPSGFPDGANNHIYVKNGVVYLYDTNGLTSESIHESFSSTVFGITIGGAWDGAFVYSFAHNAENASITPGTPNDGFTGFTGLPTTIDIGGVTLGFGFHTDAVYYNRSSLNTRTDENNIQWKQYVVDLEVKYKKTLTIGIDVTSEWMGSDSCYIEGEWYE